MENMSTRKPTLDEVISYLDVRKVIEDNKEKNAIIQAQAFEIQQLKDENARLSRLFYWSHKRLGIAIAIIGQLARYAGMLK